MLLTHALRSVDHRGAMEDCRACRVGGRQVCAHVNHVPEVAYSVASSVSCVKIMAWHQTLQGFMENDKN